MFVGNVAVFYTIPYFSEVSIFFLDLIFVVYIVVC